MITVAAGFPTTVAPIVQSEQCLYLSMTRSRECMLRPVGIGVQPRKTRQCDGPRVGQSFDLSKTLAFCQKYDLWLVEDNCDALGCSYSMPGLWLKLSVSLSSSGLDEGPDRVIRWTGTWGDISTQTFTAPPHHGRGWSRKYSGDQAQVVAESFRDWGRDCWCPVAWITPATNAGWQLGECLLVTTTSTPTPFGLQPQAA